MEFYELQQIVESNSRTIQAMLEAQASDRLQRAELQQQIQTTNARIDAAISRMDESIARLTTLNEGVVNLLSSLDSDRPTILRKLNAIENKVDQLLERGSGDNDKTSQ